MQILNNNPLILAGADGEQITVRAKSRLPGDTVAFALDGVGGGALPNPFTFKLNKAKRNPSILTLVFTFVDTDGAFEITVTGSGGGPQSFFIFNQFGVGVGSIAYTFSIA